MSSTKQNFCIKFNKVLAQRNKKLRISIEKIPLQVLCRRTENLQYSFVNPFLTALKRDEISLTLKWQGDVMRPILVGGGNETPT